MLRFRSPGLRWGDRGKGKATLLVAALLFFVPSVCWFARNFVTMGAFPVLPGNPGTTFYGSWNVVTTSTGHGFANRFAGWTPVGVLPGEKSREQMAAEGLTELEVERYYSNKGVQFVRTHWRIVPVIVAGHFARLLLPAYSAAPSSLRARYQIPEWICRLGLYGAAMVLLIWKQRPRAFWASWYALTLSATGLTVTMTTMLLYGEQRLIYPMTVLLVPFVCGSIWTTVHKSQAVRVTDSAI